MMKSGLIQCYTGSGKGKCLRGNSLVQTDKGYHILSDMGIAETGEFGKVRDIKLVDHLGTTKAPSKFFNNGYANCFKVSTNSGYYIEGVSEHRLLTLDEETLSFTWKEIGNLREGDFVALSRGDNLFGVLSLDSRVARYLGILIADGSRDISGIKLNGFQLSTKDKEIADFLYNNSMLATGGQCCKCMTSRGLYKLTWGLGSFVYVKDNYGLDMSNTADNKTVPELVLKCNRDTVLSFMEGLFTDFTIQGSSKNLTLGYICTNEYLRTQVKIILLNLGILTSSKDKQVVTKKYPKGKSYFYTLFRGVECFKLYSTINIPRIKQYMESWEESTFNSNIDVIPANRYLVSKIKGYTYNSNSYNICRNVRGRKWGVGLDILSKYFEESGDRNVEHLLNDRYLWQRIVSIESTGIHPTYDLEVDSTHSYVANGFISHNTTSAFGLVMRAIGQDWNVLVAQFMKGDSTADKTYGELKSCQLFKNHITILQSHDKVPYRVILEHNKSDEDKLLVRETWLSMMDELGVGKVKREFIETGVIKDTFVPYNMLVLDEILGALNLSLISQKTFFEFIREIKESRPDLEIVLTGRMWSEPLYDKIKDISDLMSDIRCVKHYFNKTCTICKRSFEYRSNYCPNCGSELRTVPIREGVDV